MRIRSIKPEFWRSQDIADLEWSVRLLFIGLWSYVDDNGVGRDDSRIITAELFALESRDYRDTLASVSEGLDVLAKHGRIVRYTVLSTPYLEIVNWSKHQKIDHPNKPRYPRSDHESAIRSRESRESVAQVAGIVATGTGEQGNRGTEEQGKEPLSPDESDDPGILIPADWRPNQRHIDKAASLHLDVKHEYHRFREHAERTQRRQKNEAAWNTAFTNWLRKGAELAQQRQGRPAYPTARPTRGEENLAYLQRVMSEQPLEITQ